MKKSWLIQLSGGMILIGMWEGLTWGFQVPEYIFPRFSALIVEFLRFPTFFLEGLFTTSLESCAGLLFGGITAYFLAVIFSFSTLLKHLFYQWFVALKTVPIIAISPMIVIWVGSGMGSKVLMASIITFFPILVNTLQGFYNITENHFFNQCLSIAKQVPNGFFSSLFSFIVFFRTLF